MSKNKIERNNTGRFRDEFVKCAREYTPWPPKNMGAGCVMGRLEDIIRAEVEDACSQNQSIDKDKLFLEVSFAFCAESEKSTTVTSPEDYYNTFSDAVFAKLSETDLQLAGE